MLTECKCNELCKPMYQSHTRLPHESRLCWFEASTPFGLCEANSPPTGAAMFDSTSGSVYVAHGLEHHQFRLSSYHNPSLDTTICLASSPCLHISSFLAQFHPRDNFTLPPNLETASVWSCQMVVSFRSSHYLAGLSRLNFSFFTTSSRRQNTKRMPTPPIPHTDPNKCEYRNYCM
ncbi:unnamed protein product [Protopolystoma xenopodis]|uniref:Uncharacterized protein n=1 Tax=Protopolystoma xenopodis TaxID=117903 RepID=A0A3S5B8Q6_9PLAT|nr:unnamed protein product [Protopolystoma xenopodis]